MVKVNLIYSEIWKFQNFHILEGWKQRSSKKTNVSWYPFTRNFANSLFSHRVVELPALHLQTTNFVITNVTKFCTNNWTFRNLNLYIITVFHMFEFGFITNLNTLFWHNTIRTYITTLNNIDSNYSRLTSRRFDLAKGFRLAGLSETPTNIFYTDKIFLAASAATNFHLNKLFGVPNISRKIFT